MILKDRDWRLIIQTEDPDANDVAEAVDVSGLDIEFEIEKSLDPEPNRAKVTVYNLSPDHRRAIESFNIYDPKRKKGEKKPKADKAAWSKDAPRLPKVGKIRVELEAGYIGARPLLFRGDLRRALTTVDDTGTFKTEIEGEDGGSSILGGRIRETFPPDTSMYTVVQACLRAMGLTDGNLIEVADKLRAQRASHGLTLFGLASDQLKGVTRRLGVTWSVQNGGVVFARLDPDVVTAVVLSKDTGLVGRPSRMSTGRVEARSLINPELHVGGYVSLDVLDEQYRGTFRIVSTKHHGSTFGNDWYVTMELKPA